MFLESFKIVIPMGLMMLAGYFVKLAKLSTDAGVKMLDNLVYRLFMPSLMFYSIVTCPDIGTAGNRFYVLAIIGQLTATVGVAIALHRCAKEERVAMLIGTCRTNVSVYGSAISAAMLSGGEAKQAMLYLSFAAAIQNMILLGALEIMESSKLSPLHILLKVVRNPQITAAIGALVLNLLHVQLPEIVLSPLESLAKCATPIAFLMLGISFCISHNRGENLHISIVILLRLIVVPTILLLPIAAIFRPEGAELVALACLLASPCAVSSLPISNQFGGNPVIINESVVWTSALSILTFPVFINLCNLLCAR